MFKRPVISVSKLIASPSYMGSLVIIVLMLSFIGYQSWKEYQIYEINEVFESFPTASGDSTLRVISWWDDADDENGYVIERKGAGDYIVITTLNADSTYYEDYSELTEGTYCYRVGAYNQAGTAYADELCLEILVDTNDSGGVDPIDESEQQTDGVLSIVSDMITNKENIDLNGREFYSVKSDYSFNADFSTNEITSVNFTIGYGSLSYKDSTMLTFMQDDHEVEHGYAFMKYNELNNFSFVLEGDGTEQVATLYIAAGAWGVDSAELEIKAGNISEIITLPSNYTWHYITVDITFDQSTSVELTPVGQHGGYSGIKVAGIVLNNEILPDNEILTGFASLIEVDHSSSSSIDVSTSEYITSEGVIANEDYSDGSITGITYSEDFKYRDKTYLFLDNGDEVASGYTGMPWDELNSVALNLNSSAEQTSVASLYFRAGAWTNDLIELELIINGESSLIELTKGYKWFYIRADVEFQGALDIELKPVGVHGGYSYLYFAGLTLTE